jgi:uncharacterized membrane protein YhaH (DUF805 family)
MFEPLRRYAQFNGRARRAEYWQFYLFLVVITVLVAALVFSGFKDWSPDDKEAIVYAIVFLPLGVPGIAVSVRRMHDSSRTGWWLLIGLVPIVGGLIFFVLSVLDGTAGPNRFGPDPKGRDVAEVFA